MIDAWSFDNRGYFVRQRYSLDESNTLHQCAKNISDCIVSSVANVQSIHLRGTALDILQSANVFDIDIIVILRGQPTRDSRQHVITAASRAPKCPVPLDVTVLYEDTFTQDIRSSIQLVLAFRSYPLFGSPIWKPPPLIRPDRNLARKLATSFIKNTDAKLADLEDYHIANQKLIVPWLQKKTMRFGSLIALEEQSYTHHPSDCVQFLQSKYPDLANRVLAVEADLYESCLSPVSFERCGNLYSELREVFIRDYDL